jgi:hypothetical protein
MNGVSRFFHRAVARVHPALERVDPPLRGAVLGRIFCSREHQFVYFRIPKAANTSVVAAIVDRRPASAGGRGGRAGKRTTREFLTSGILRPEHFERYFTCTFVRNPFSRVLSAYLDKIAALPVKREFRRRLAIGDAPMSFRGFLERLEAGFLHADVHWAPQTAILPVLPASIAFVGRVETIERDLPIVLARIFGPNARTGVPAAGHHTGASSRLFEFYGAAETTLVRRLYEPDFAAFYPDVKDPAEGLRPGAGGPLI